MIRKGDMNVTPGTMQRGSEQKPLPTELKVQYFRNGQIDRKVSGDLPACNDIKMQQNGKDERSGFAMIPIKNEPVVQTGK
jgi:hypothetical protein